jgi:hypothetical protein
MKSGAAAEKLLTVVHIHMGPALPDYFWATVRQTRRFHAGPIVCVLPLACIDLAAVQALSLTVISNETFDDAPLVSAVNKVSWLTTQYGAGGFWHYAMLRLFVLESVMERLSLDVCLHLENDVLIYGAPQSLSALFDSRFFGQCAVLPLGPSAGCTAALMYVGASKALTALCVEMLDWLAREEREIRSVLRSDMVNEMVLLGLIRLVRPELLGVLPVSPYPPNRGPTVARRFKPWARPFLRLADAIAPKKLNHVPQESLGSHLQAFGYLFDPASWGQYVGGTPHGEGPGFTAPHHWIGNDLRAGRYQIRWDTDGEGRRIPYVKAPDDGSQEWPLFNLHIHSKNMLDFM